MDRIDREILSVLAADGRRSYREIGEAVHLSANAVAERVRRLLKEGAVRAIRADIDPAVVGRPVEAQIDVKLRPGISAEDFERALLLLPQVVSATLMTGTYDYVLRVACTDRADLVHVTETLRSRSGALETYGRVILREVRLPPWRC
ncbi:MAG TPA: Lrp/AsnC family transcriptional regulator [Roseateles sp.]|uniref:Lrp/AsnC family transcriptional regulator n=1 Tax=Roseateles sp. TaxID=1971397 RepID=UPI002ED957D1